jgi:tetratricopeptide (TPR) repeat protein
VNEATLPPEEASMWLRLGLRAARAGDYAEARRYFQWAREAAPDNVVALLWSAGLAGNRDQAVALLTRVLELEPHNEHARAGLRALGQADDTPGPTNLGVASDERGVPMGDAEAPIYRKVGQEDTTPTVGRPEQWSRWLLAMLLAAVVLVLVGFLALAQLRGSLSFFGVPLDVASPTRPPDPTVIMPVVTETLAPLETSEQPWVTSIWRSQQRASRGSPSP